jgi:DNA mismatch endonuclease Vsr
MDKFSQKVRSALMSRVRTSGTDIELVLLKCVRHLWTKERYRRNVKNLPGKPDIVFPKSKIAIFADGDFWHGKNFKKWNKNIPKFWQNKISLNIERDKRNNKALRKEGYRIIRFWGSVIKKRPKGIVVKVNKTFGQPKF